MILQQLPFQKENVKSDLKPVFREAGIQSISILQTVHL